MLHRFSSRPLMVVAFVTLILTGVFGGVAYATAQGRDNGHFIAFFIQRMADQLGLSEEQQAQIRQILEEERTVAEPLMQQLKSVRDQMRTLGTDGVFNEAQVRVLAQQQSQTMTELVVAKERTKARIAAVLTPEQRERAKQMLEHFHRRLRGGHKRHHGHGFRSLPPFPSV
ncbi:MAG: Spy/CpxP family protein refolding chaperone [Acidobacteriota bacterium]